MLEQGLPEIAKEHFQNNYCSELLKLNNTHNMPDATNTPTAIDVTEEGGFEVLEGREMIPFDTNNERHQALIVLAQLNELYRCVSLSIKDSANQLPLEQSLDVLEQLGPLEAKILAINLNIMTLIHGLMKTEWPQFFVSRYKHVVLTDENMETGRLNLDSYQPRNGYLNQESLTPLEQL